MNFDHAIVISSLASQTSFHVGHYRLEIISTHSSLYFAKQLMLENNKKHRGDNCQAASTKQAYYSTRHSEKITRDNASRDVLSSSNARHSIIMNNNNFCKFPFPFSVPIFLEFHLPNKQRSKNSKSYLSKAIISN